MLERISKFLRIDKNAVGAHGYVYGPDDHCLSPEMINQDARKVVDVLQNAGHEAYVVGGCVRDLLLLGYHGKLIKLAGGIFHTHHHLADGRLEVLVALGLGVWYFWSGQPAAASKLSMLL